MLSFNLNAAAEKLTYLDSGGRIFLKDGSGSVSICFPFITIFSVFILRVMVQR